MKAYQCDRCFRYYTANKDIPVPGKGSNVIATGVKILGPETSGSTVPDSKKYELCDDCLKKLVDFLAYRDET